MLTPQDIQNKEFTKAVFGGYDMTTVDDFLETVMEDYGSLYKENAILKSKIKVLVEKVEEYRSTEDAMRMALLTAQKIGDDLLKDAEAKKQGMLEDAETLLKNKKQEIARELELEEFRLRAAKERTARFVQASRQLMAGQEDFIAKLDELLPEPAPEPAPAPEELEKTRESRIAGAAEEIGAAVGRLVEEPAANEPQGPPAYDDEGEPTRLFKAKMQEDGDEEDEDFTPRPKFDFNDLQFGKNYGISEK
jgi:cell division initiation protein